MLSINRAPREKYSGYLGFEMNLEFEVSRMEIE